MTLLLNLAIGSTATFAADPVQTITQYGHRAWRIGDAGMPADPSSVAQTGDGYIWLGAADGLYRFDGVGFSHWQPTRPSPLPLNDVVSLFAAGDGTLYVGGTMGTNRLRDGHTDFFFKSIPSPGSFFQKRQPGPISSRPVYASISDPAARPVAYCIIRGRSDLCIRLPDADCAKGNVIAQGNGSEIWIGGYGKVCRVDSTGRVQTFPIISGDGEAPAQIYSLVRGSDGTMWAGTLSQGNGLGLLRFDGRKWASFVRAGFDGRTIDVRLLHVDRSGSLWIGTFSHGLYRLVGTRVDHFDRTDGLTSNRILDIAEDREGSMWVLTPSGLDQFYDQPIVRYTKREGLSDDLAQNAVATPAGPVLVSNERAIDIIGRSAVTSAPYTVGIEHQNPLIFVDRSGVIWSGRGANVQVGLGPKARTIPLPGVSPKMSIISMTQDRTGDVWLATRDQSVAPSTGRLWRIHDFRVAQTFESPAETGHRMIDDISADPGGGLWVSVYKHGLFKFVAGHFDRVPAIAADGEVTGVDPFNPRTAWISTPRGMVLIEGENSRALGVANGLPCPIAYDTAYDRGGNLWLQLQCGIVSISRAELLKWARDTSAILHPLILGTVVGEGAGPYLYPFSKATDGTFWFAFDGSVFRFNPERAYAAKPWPPIYVQSLIADGHNYPTSNDVQLRPQPKDVQIDYAALTYRVPQSTRYFYRLVGGGREWSGLTTHRDVFFNDLKPGLYTFQVWVCARVGNCEPDSASATFTIPPTLFQTLWFKAVCIGIVAALIWLLYAIRIRRVAARIQQRMDERLDERERIARELHDTLLQSFQGLMLRLQSATERIRRSIMEHKPVDPSVEAFMVATLDHGDRVLTEGRDRVLDLRTPGPSALDAVLEDTARRIAQMGPSDTMFRIRIDGENEPLQPIICRQLGDIGSEAITNAYAHANASSIDVILRFRLAMFSLIITDDGEGLKQSTLEAHARGKHFGFRGMEERSSLIGGVFSVVSAPGAGTRIEVRVPARRAYARRSGILVALRAFVPRRTTG